MGTSSNNRSRESLLFSIGEFSRIASLSLKALRLYHEKGLLIPKWVDEATGYRYYDDRNIEQARAISYMRGLMIPLAEIREILDRFAEDADILDFLEKHREAIRLKMEQLNTASLSLDDIIQKEKEAKKMTEENLKNAFAGESQAHMKYKEKFTEF